MSYTTLATSQTPALIIYLIDISRSMNDLNLGQRRIDIVFSAIEKAITRMVLRSTKGATISPRYRIAMYGYHKSVIDLLGGIKSINELVEIGLHLPNLDYGTQTASGFSAIEKLLHVELPKIQDCPAPLICHLTDGLYGGQDPATVVERIKSMRVKDGGILIENIFLVRNILTRDIYNIDEWEGVRNTSQLRDKEYVLKLFELSSHIPDSYLTTMREFGYNLQPGARMLFPGNKPELVELGIAMSSATPIT